ncbi:hypothetical protein C7S15_7563 [Burkholderia cepacia]|nr:hypothetical protein [Burkholderia cepacia]
MRSRGSARPGSPTIGAGDARSRRSKSRDADFGRPAHEPGDTRCFGA